MAVETPNGFEFSIGAKTYLCAGRLLPKAGIMYGYPSPQSHLVDHRELAPGILGCTLDWLEANNYAQLWQDSRKIGFANQQVIMVRAVYSGAPGLSGRFLEATGWVDADLPSLASRLLPADTAPFVAFLDNVSAEFVEAGILTRGRYAAHGNVWNAEWLTYLTEAWLPEVWEAWQRTHARPDWALARKNLMFAKEVKREIDNDDD
ncbi:MAG: hypothetical protein Q7W44_05000 [Coriobacteriia bacterium]|nr:hypothetical protein [Coriobacteriia bacterium]